MSVVALSPMAAEPPSPMLTSITPTLDPAASPSSPTDASPVSLNVEGGGASSLDPGPSRGPDPDSSGRSRKPPPLHTGADWKVVLHLPEIETWLRTAGDRVTQLSHSVGQDGDGRHVDVHLVQLKDICEDISDHVEQIHALLETEFSLKLLSYSVNIIVDIRTVQLLWHQLRVSVLVLKERLLQGLQDSNGNFTRQTDILQAFSQDQHQDQHQVRLEALTEVDDCGQLTIRCSQDYFSLDCGITAFELSDYSPSDDLEAPEPRPSEPDPSRYPDQEPGSLPDLSPAPDSTDHPPGSLPTMQKRHLQGVSLSTEVSPTQPSLPKRAALFSAMVEASRGGVGKPNPLSGLQIQAELSRSTPSLVDPPDRSKFWLELDSVYPENVSQSYESLQVVDVSSRHGGFSEGSVQTPPSHQRSSSGAEPAAAAPRLLQGPGTQDETNQTQRMKTKTLAHSEEDSDSSLPSPMREQLLSSDLEASGEESDPRPPPGRTAVWIVKRQKAAPSAASPDREHWYGSEEFLALPAQLRKTEMLAVKLESLTQSIPPRPEDSTQEALQDVDDWDLTELNPDWDVGEDAALPSLLPPRRPLVGRFSPASSSDIAPSLDESLESGRLSDLQSEEEEEEGRKSADARLQPTAVTTTTVDGRRCASLVQQLLEDVQSQDKDSDIWRKIECFVDQLDGFISWLQDSLDDTENWTQPRQDLDSLRVYLDTHLSFKLNVDDHGALKERIMEDGKELLATITSHQSVLKEILHMVSSQWDQLQRQIRRQHGWMLRALRCIQSRLFYTSQSHGPFAAPQDLSANQEAPCSAQGLKVELSSSPCEAQRVALEQMAIKLSRLHYPPPASRRHCSLQEFEAEYQEVWDWLMDMDAMVTDSHQLLMSEEQRHHLFKSSHAELMMMESRRTGLLGRAESLRRSRTQLPQDFQHKIHNLTHTWRQLEKILSDHSGPSSVSWNHVSRELAVPPQTPLAALSPPSPLLLEQLESRIKELKVWLRDTELLIFNHCLRQDKDASEQLQSFKSLCLEIRARRRGVSSVLKLCQKLLQQSQSGSMAEVGPDAEQHREALQLLSINLERRWEAIVMQALQWQNRLKREQQVLGNFLEPGLVDLHQISPVSAGPAVLAPDDSWEWDETDLTITESEPQPDLTHDLPTAPGVHQDQDPPSPGPRLAPASGIHQDQDPPSPGPRLAPAPRIHQDPPSPGPHLAPAPRVHQDQDPPSPGPRLAPAGPGPVTRPGLNVYQVYSLHTVELYNQPPAPPPSTLLHRTTAAKRKQHLLLKSLSKDSSFSSIESLPDLLLGGLMSNGRGSGESANSRRSECESGIVSDTGETQAGEEEEEEEETGEEAGGGSVSRQRTDVKKERGRRRRCRRGGGDAVELLTPAGSDSEGGGVTEEVKGGGVESQGSSLESLLALGLELFPSKDALHRSASLENGLETGGGASGPRDLGQRRGSEGGEGRRSSTHGELSRRTLDLLERLENIQTPLANMTRSVSDMTLRTSSSPQRSRLPASPSLGGRLAPPSGRRAPPSLTAQGSGTASLTELSSAEESSLASEELRPPHNLLLDQRLNNNTAWTRRRGPGSRGGPGAEEADGASLSMVVNVSACTDEEEDDSDLLSSSTLTLTEEELGVRDEDEEGEEEGEGRLSGSSSTNEEEDEEEVLGLEYMKKELQSWIRAPRASSSSSRTEAGLWDELQCGTTSFTSSSSPQKETSKTKGDRRGTEEEQENRRSVSYMSRLVDDVENGNVEQSGSRGKEEDDQLLREESSVFTKKGEVLREALREALHDVDNQTLKTESEKLLLPFSSKRGSSLVGELRGELPCHNSSLPASPPSLSPVEDCRKSITIQEKFKFSSFVTEHTRSEVRDKHSSRPPKKWLSSHASCCSHLPSAPPAPPPPPPKAKEENVHEFVMEIIDMTSLALKSKENQREESTQAERGGSIQDQGPAALTQIRDKVLQHSHRPLHLRKGDFYSYLSLSSHDSDCGEVVQFSEEQSSTPAPPSYSPDLFTSTNQQSSSSRRSSPSLHATSPDLRPDADTSTSPPPSPDIRDEETLFAACTEEVYLGPPLCYSMVLPKRPRRLLLDAAALRSRDTAPPDGSSPTSLVLQGPGPEGGGADLLLLCDVAAGEAASAVLQEQGSRNEGPPYLNPRARVGPIASSSSSAAAAAACLADTGALQSNMAAVMTPIRVCGSATNPSEEREPHPSASSSSSSAAARINPKYNCSPMRGADRGEEGEEEGERRRSETTVVKQVNLKPAVNHATRTAEGRSQGSVRPPTSRMMMVRGAGASRIQL
ncbi:A-kinase anchor protein 6 [Mugil cephalus]|uniref:A-kinase anchor protein 6 n=1 Tax=Mugil cephalus TaxID=48193 RepID=UPI001FB801D0|nr:A-kinase anchor protein 6 [Mugil cephalus]